RFGLRGWSPGPGAVDPAAGSLLGRRAPAGGTGREYGVTAQGAAPPAGRHDVPLEARAASRAEEAVVAAAVREASVLDPDELVLGTTPRAGLCRGGPNELGVGVHCRDLRHGGPRSLPEWSGRTGA